MWRMAYIESSRGVVAPTTTGYVIMRIFRLPIEGDLTPTEYGVMRTFRLLIGNALTLTFPEIGEGGPPAAVVEVDP